MEKIIREGTPKTPYILADPDDGLLQLKGRSNPENSAEFYKPIIDWLDEFIESDREQITLLLDLEHFNTSSSKCIMDIMKRLKKLNTSNRTTHITWYYEEDDEEMLEAAETYEAMSGLKIDKVSKPVSDRDLP